MGGNLKTNLQDIALGREGKHGDEARGNASYLTLQHCRATCDWSNKQWRVRKFSSRGCTWKSLDIGQSSNKGCRLTKIYFRWSINYDHSFEQDAIGLASWWKHSRQPVIQCFIPFCSIMWTSWCRGELVHSRPSVKCFLWTERQHTSKEWPTELCSGIIMVCIHEWHQSISTGWLTDSIYHLCCIHSGEFPGESVGGVLHPAVIYKWDNLDRL